MGNCYIALVSVFACTNVVKIALFIAQLVAAVAVCPVIWN